MARVHPRLACSSRRAPHQPAGSPAVSSQPRLRTTGVGMNWRKTKTATVIAPHDVRMPEFTNADLAQAFGGWAHEYERYRPSYPREVVQWLLEDLSPNGSGNLRVADVGAGTGLMTRVVSALGYDVVMVEPDDAMREQALDAIGRDLVEAVDGTAEEIPLADHSVDAVIAAQMWHWVDHDRAAREVARILKPGGRIGLVWNILVKGQTWWDDVLVITGPGRMQIAESPNELGEPFTTLQAQAFFHEVSMSVDDILALVNTWSYVRLRNDRDQVLHRVRQVLDGNGTDPISVRYEARAYRAQRN